MSTDFKKRPTYNGANLLVAGDTVTIQDGGGSITVDGPLTDTQLRASAVPVSGPATDAQLRATALPVSAAQLPAVLAANGGLKIESASRLQTSTQADYFEDQDHANGDMGHFMLGVRRDTGAAFTSADGDYSAIAVDSNGRVKVYHDQTLAVSGPLTDAQIRATALPVSGPLTDAQLRASAVPVLSAGAVASGAADSGNPIKIGGRFNTTQPTLTDGQRGDAQLDTRGNLKVALFANNGVTAAGIIVPADAAASAAGLRVTSQALLYNGATWDMMRGDTANGLDVDVTRLPSLVAGTAYVGRTRQTDGTLDLTLLNAAPGSDTGQVAVPVRVISQLGAGAGGGGTQFAEDAGHTNGDLGMMMLGVRRDANGPFTSTDGDYSALAVDSKGRLFTVVDQPLPAGTNNIGDVDVLTLPTIGQLPVALAAGGGLKVEGVAGGVAQPVSLASLPALAAGTNNIGDVDVLTMPVVQVGDNSGSLTTDSTQLPAALAANGGMKVEGVAGGVAQPVSLATLPALVAGTANIGDVDVLTLPALPAGSNNIGDVDVLTMPVVQVGDNGASLTVDGAITADTELPTAAALADNMANPTTPLVGAVQMAYDGTQMGRRRSLEAFKTASATPDVGLAALALAERRFSSVNLATALNSVQSFDCNGAAEAVMHLGTTITGTVIFEVSADGTNWINAEAWLGNTNRVVSGISLTPTANDVYRIQCVGQRLVRIRTASTLGATVAVTATLTPFNAAPQRSATGQGRTLLFAAISAAASGANTLVAAGGAGLKVKLVSYMLIAEGTVAATFQSGAGGTALSGALPLVANAGAVVPGTPSSHIMETAANTLLNLNLSAAVGVRGHLSYFLEP